jgi:hypothetical protein
MNNYYLIACHTVGRWFPVGLQGNTRKRVEERISWMERGRTSTDAKYRCAFRTGKKTMAIIKEDREVKITNGGHTRKAWKEFLAENE